METGRRTAAWICERVTARLGPSGPARYGLDPAAGSDSELFAWWVACGLLAAERSEERVAKAFGALRSGGWLTAPKLAGAGSALARAFERAEIKKPRVQAVRLTRGAANLEEQYGGSLARLAGEASGFEELGTRLVSLGPGFGPGTALRFLRPLRDAWSAADEAPLDPAAHAAAVHCGWLDELDDPEMAPGTLRRALGDEAGAPPLPAFEAVLERLGRTACRGGKTRWCPFAAECPTLD